MKNEITKHPGGRPTKYNADTLRKVEEYFETLGGKEQMELPSIEGLALFLDVRRETLWSWGKEHPEFSNTIKKLEEKQKKQLMNDGMYGGKEVNASMAIFLLKANHGMSDGSGTKVQVNNIIGVKGSEYAI